MTISLVSALLTTFSDQPKEHRRTIGAPEALEAHWRSHASEPAFPVLSFYSILLRAAFT